MLKVDFACRFGRTKWKGKKRERKKKPTKIFVKKIRILFTQDYIRSYAQNETVGRQKRIVSISFLKLEEMYAYFLWCHSQLCLKRNLKSQINIILPNLGVFKDFLEYMGFSGTRWDSIFRSMS